MPNVMPFARADGIIPRSIPDVCLEIDRKRRIIEAFSAATTTYEAAAEPQIRAARMLVNRVRTVPAGVRVLEVGCGTGLLTHLLLPLLGDDGRILATDLSPAMVETVRQALHDPRVDFGVMDAEYPDQIPESFDLVISSMAAQWFSDLPMVLSGLSRLLRPGGRLCLSTLGAETFRQWRSTCRELGLECGVPDYLSPAALASALPGASVVAIPFDVFYADARAFLRQLKAIGATTPRAGYRRQTAGDLRRAMASLGTPCCITWNVLILNFVRER